MVATLFISLFTLMILGVPIAFALAIACWFALLVTGSYPQLVIVKEMFTGLDSFPLLAVPFFILAAELMTGGAMTLVLLRFASQFVGHIRGGLGYANILSSTMFAGISGSALADAAGPGAMMAKMMQKGGYDLPYAGALTSASAVIGPIIPPSIIMIIYALQDDRVSVIGLFMAGILPGILIAAVLAATNFIVCRRRDYRGKEARPPLREMVKTTARALPALMLIVIVVGGIRFGVFTPTEASVVAVFYALFCGTVIYRSLKLQHLPSLILSAALTSCGVLLILAAARAFAWLLVIEGVPQALASAIIALDLSPIVFLLAINVLLLIFGLFMDPLPGVTILVPILAPIAHALGIDPIHFALLVIVNLTVGLITPPVGSLLFVVSSTLRLRVSDLTREMTPFFIAYVLVILMLTFVPAISTWLPTLGGY